MQYVVEITIKPWDPAHPRNQNATGEMKTHPLHTDECGNVYFRRQASVMQVPAEAWISNHWPSEMWDKITYPFPNFNGATVEVWEWISNFISHFVMDVIT